MTSPIASPFGSWKSPVTSDLYASAYSGLGEIIQDHDDLYWLESRAREQGRQVVVHLSRNAGVEDVTAPPFNARTLVHEYGGGSYVVHDGAVYFSNYEDQRLYKKAKDAAPAPLTPLSKLRYADAVIDARRNQLICVREDHSSGDQQAVNSLVSIDLDKGGPGEILVSGNDFYSNPRVSPDGSRLTWLTWNFPNMPWDGSEVWVGKLDGGGFIRESQLIAGGLDESIFQPEWSPNSELCFISDRTGWWNLYRLHGNAQDPLHPLQAEFGYPQWVFRLSSYAFETGERILCSYTLNGVSHLAELNLLTRKLELIEIPYTDIYEVHASPGRATLLVGSPTEATTIIALNLDSHEIAVLRRSRESIVDDGYLSVPTPIDFPTGGNLTAYALYYAPANKDYAAPLGELPPLIVMSHGGPTSQTTSTLRYGIQYWTSRGFAVLDVNYGGSTGYGRAYRERLKGNWGIVDVDDCVNGALYLVKRGMVDSSRLAIAGGSAGGYTTMCALTFRNIFRAGASYFGVSSLEGLVKETHKFESRYLDRLVGPYPERKDLYEERSALNHADQISAAIILFQGLEDKVVPPNQSEQFFKAAKKKGLPTAYLTFEGEQHGFRKAENIKRSIEAELYFYSKLFHFTPADQIETVNIENLNQSVVNSASST